MYTHLYTLFSVNLCIKIRYAFSWMAAMIKTYKIVWQITSFGHATAWDMASNWNSFAYDKKLCAKINVSKNSTFKFHSESEMVNRYNSTNLCILILLFFCCFFSFAIHFFAQIKKFQNVIHCTNNQIGNSKIEPLTTTTTTKNRWRTSERARKIDTTTHSQNKTYPI